MQRKVERAMRSFLNEIAIKGYSPRTIDSYTRCLKEYFSYIRLEINLEKPSYGHIRDFLAKKAGAGMSSSTLNIYLCAIKFFYKHVACSKRKIHVSFAKKAKRLPVVLSRNEILRCLEVLKNEKHRLMIAIAYGAGLRVSEVVDLKIGDLDFERGLIHIRQSKGNRDRITILPDKLVSDLVSLCRRNPGWAYVFQSQRGGKLTVATAQKVFKASLEKAGIRKNATFHSLRHSFATHLLDERVSLRHIQKLLGHRDIKTTLVYAQVTDNALEGVKSPL